MKAAIITMPKYPLIILVTTAINIFAAIAGIAALISPTRKPNTTPMPNEMRINIANRRIRRNTLMNGFLATINPLLSDAMTPNPSHTRA